jgi:O-antigen/teichoic acid export membrane protein
MASRFLNFLLVPFYTHVLSPADFGISNILFAVIAFLNIIYQFGFDSAYLRCSQDLDEVNRKKMFASAFWSQAIGCVLFSLLLLMGYPLLNQWLFIPEAHKNLLLYASAILILDTLSVIPFSRLRQNHNALHFALIRMANVLINIAANIILVAKWHKGLEGVFIANLLASTFTILCFTPDLLRRIRFQLDLTQVKQLLIFGLPLVPAGLYGMVNEMAGRLFLARMRPEDLLKLYPNSHLDVLTLTGIFSAAWKLGIFGLLLVQMYRLAWQPFFLQRQKDADAPELFGRILRLLCLFIGFASVTLMFLLDKLVAIPIMGRPLIHPAFWSGLPIVPLVLLAYALQAWLIHFTLGIYIRKQTKYFMWVNGIGAILTLLGNFLLIPYFGLQGPALAAVICYAIMAILMTRRSQELFPITIAWPKMILIFIWLGLGWVFGAWIQFNPHTFSLSLRALLLAIFYALPWILGFITPAEKQILFGPLKGLSGTSH